MALTQTTDPSDRCILCGSLMDGPALGSHLAECLAKRTSFSKAKPIETFHLKISGDGWSTGSVYSIHVLARADATLLNLDRLLRETWMEPCCGHLSAFAAGAERYESYPDDEFPPPAKAMGDTLLHDVLSRRKTISYEYDYGSTTELRVQVLDRSQNVMKGRHRVELVARNVAPSHVCASCSEPATRVCAVGCDAPEALACSRCAGNHLCGEEMMSPIVNSPRTGVCGYPTEPMEESEHGWVTA